MVPAWQQLEVLTKIQKTVSNLANGGVSGAIMEQDQSFLLWKKPFIFFQTSNLPWICFKMNEQVTHFWNADLLLVWALPLSAWGCVGMSESLGECGLAGRVMMTISAAGFYECHLYPHTGIAERWCDLAHKVNVIKRKIKIPEIHYTLCCIVI